MSSRKCLILDDPEHRGNARDREDARKVLEFARQVAPILGTPAPQWWHTEDLIAEELGRVRKRKTPKGA